MPVERVAKTQKSLGRHGLQQLKVRKQEILDRDRPAQVRDGEPGAIRVQFLGAAAQFVHDHLEPELVDWWTTMKSSSSGASSLSGICSFKRSLIRRYVE